MLTLDHIAVGCERLEDGVAWVEDTLGVALQTGGQHAYYGTHNALMHLGPNLYLEVIAKDPVAAPTGRAAWFGLDTFKGPPRLANWLCRADDMTAYAAITGPAVPLSRRNLEWETTVPADGSLPMDAGFPSLIRWANGAVPPPYTLPKNGCDLVSLTVTHPEADWLRRTLTIDGPAVVFETGPAALSARINTPSGMRTLGSV